MRNWERLRSLTGPELRGLDDALRDAYRQREEIAQLLFYHLDKLLDEIVPPTNFKNTSFQLISSARQENWLPELVRAVLDDRPNNVSIRAWVDQTLGITTAHPSQEVVQLSHSPVLGKERQESSRTQPALLAWLKNTWLPKGPSVCAVEGFSGIGKSYLAEQLRSVAGCPSVLIELPNAATSLGDFLLMAVSALDRDANIHIPLGSDLVVGIEQALQQPLLLVIDDFQYSLDPETNQPTPEFMEFFSRLRSRRSAGRLLVITSQTIDEDEWVDEGHALRTLRALPSEDGAKMLSSFLENRGREAEVPSERLLDVTDWLGSNPRAMQALVAALRFAPLEELIGAEILESEIGYRYVGNYLIERLENRFMKRTLDNLSEASRATLNRLSVYRKSFQREALTLASQAKILDTIVAELVSLFLLDRRRNWYSLNPTARELALRSVLRDTSMSARAHHLASDYYMRPFRARRTSVGRNAGNFMEARHHLVLAGRESDFRTIAQMFALHLQRVYGRSTPLPTNPDELEEQILLLQAALANGSPSPLLHFRLARLFLFRGQDADDSRAIEETEIAVQLPPATTEIWVLHLRLIAQLYGVDELLTGIDQACVSLPEKATLPIYRLAAELLVKVERAGEAIELLRAGIGRLGPEHNVASLYQVAAELLVKVERAGEAIELVRAGIERLGPEHNVVSLYRLGAELLLKAERAGEALELVRAGIERLGPEHNVLSLYRLAAELLVKAERAGEAIELLRAGIGRVGPEHNVFSLYQVAAELLVKMERGGEAIELVRAGIERLGPEHNVVSLYQIGAGLLVKAERGGEAIELLRAGIDRVDPEHTVVTLYQAAARLLVKAERAGEAIELIEAGIDRVGPEHNVFSLYQVAAELLVKAERAGEAIELLQAGIGRVDPEHNVVTLYQAASGLLVKAERGGEATELIEAGIDRLGPEHNVVSLYQIGAGLLVKAERGGEAIELLQAGIDRIGPEHSVFSLYRLAAELFARADRGGEAIELLRAGIDRLGPEHSVFSLYLVAAELFARADRGGEAIELLRAGIDRLGPEHNVFSLYLVAAELLVKAERGGEAIELLQVGIEQLSPEHSVVALYQASAELLAKAERAAEAIELLEEGIDRLGPEHNVFSLYLVVAELLTKSERTAEALDLLKTGIGRVGPEHSVFSLYQIASELIARSGDYQQAIQLLVDGFKRIGTRNYGHRLAEGALLLAYAMRNKDLLEEFARQIPEKSLTTFARMLELALDGRWEEGVGISQALRRGGVTSATLLGQEAFFLLCLGRWREADDILSKIESRATDLNAWLRAVAHFIGGEPDRALYYMSICLGRPLTREEQVDPILWIRTWDDKASTHGFNPAFYFPILPTELTGTKDGLRRLLCGPPALAE